MINIYYIENKLKSGIYIGQTVQDIKKRWTVHCNPNSQCIKLRNAIQYYGKENFEYNVFQAYDNQEEANQAEIYWIAKMREVFGKENVYNIDDGAYSGSTWIGKNHSEISKQKMRKPKAPRTEEHKKNQSLAQKGKKRPPRTEEHKKNLSNANKGQVSLNKGKKGLYTHTDEAKRKMSESKKGNQNAKKIK